MASIVQKTRPTVTSTLHRSEMKHRRPSSSISGKIGNYIKHLRLANVIVALSATVAFTAGFVARVNRTQANQTSLWQETLEVATAAAQKCWSSAMASAPLVERGVMSPNVFSLDSATMGERANCRVLLARDATDDDCSTLATVGGGGYFRLLYSGTYYVTVQVTVVAEAEAGCIELVVALRRRRNSNMANDGSMKQVGSDAGHSCHGSADGDAFWEKILSTAKVTLPGSSAVGGTTVASTTIYTSKLAAFQSGDEISLKLRCIGTGGKAHGEIGGCRLTVGRGSLLGLFPLELSST